MSTKFVGHLQTFEREDDSGDPVIDEDVMIDVTVFTADGIVEIAYPDRNEDVCLRIDLPALLAGVALLNGDKD